MRCLEFLESDPSIVSYFLLYLVSVSIQAFQVPLTFSFILYLKVCNAFSDRKNQYTAWWLEALHHIEQNKDSSNELIRKIGEAVSGTLNTSRASKVASWLVMGLFFTLASFLVHQNDLLSFGNCLVAIAVKNTCIGILIAV